MKNDTEKIRYNIITSIFKDIFYLNNKFIYMTIGHLFFFWYYGIMNIELIFAENII